MKRIARMLLVLLMLAAMLTGCGQKKQEDTSPTIAPAVPEQTQPVQAVPEETEATEAEAPKLDDSDPEVTEPVETIPQDIAIGESGSKETKDSDVAIETAYATLYYPGKWQAALRTEETTMDFSSAVKFYGTVDGEEYWLFTVHFGGAEGIGVGAILTEDGYMMDVTIEMSDFVPGEDWTAESADQFNAMQEAMNYVMNKLSETPGFEG